MHKKEKDLFAEKQESHHFLFLTSKYAMGKVVGKYLLRI